MYVSLHSRIYFKAASIFLVASIFCLYIHDGVIENDGYGDTSGFFVAAKRKSGGGSRTGSGGGWFGGASSPPSPKKKGGFFSSFGKKKKLGAVGAAGGLGAAGKVAKKGGALKTLKKAAVIGAVGYGAYQIGKLSGRFSNFGGGGFGGGGFGGGYQPTFNQWNNWREADGFLCRTTADCSWIDSRLFCQDRKLDFSPSRAWYGGDFASIVGECSCPDSLIWDDRELQCRAGGFGNGGDVGGLIAQVGTAIFILFIFVLIIMCCCCVGISVFIYKRFF